MVNYNVGSFNSEEMTLSEFIAYCNATSNIHTCPTRLEVELNEAITALGW